MTTPNPKKPSTPKLTPEQAAELNRRQAAKRQADKRRREKEEAEDQAAMLAENAAKLAAEEEARIAHLADVEKRLAEAEKTIRTIQERLDDAVLLLACHNDMTHIERKGVHPTMMHRLVGIYGLVGLHYRAMQHRSWGLSKAEASDRVTWLHNAVETRLRALPSYDDPVLMPSDVTVRGTPVTATVCNSDRPERIADRSQEAPPVSDEEQAWIDAQGRDPYDPYEDYVERMEAIAEGNAPEDDDDGERF